MKSSPSSTFLYKWDENEKQHVNSFSVSGQVLLYSTWRPFQVETKSNFPSMSTPFLQTEIDLQQNMALKEL